MTTYARAGGSFRTMTAIYAKSGGTWRTIVQAYAKSGGTWRTVFTLFSPVTHSYGGGSSGNETVPTGAQNLVITVYGAGARGQDADYDGTWWIDGAGGDGGGKAVKTLAIASSDWGATLAYSVKNSNEGDSTVTGTLNAGSISIAVASNASGGDTNTSGNAGSGGGTIEGPGGSGGAEIESGIGNEGGDGAPGEDSATGNPGGGGTIKFAWT